jgi:hypothetical protein
MHQRGAHGGGGGFHGGDDEGGGGGGGGGDGSRLVKIAFARTEPEAELIQGLLAEADIPSVLHRIPLGSGVYMPGPVNVMVAAEAAPRARQVLAETFVESEDQERLELEEERRLARGETGVVSPGKLAFWIAVIAIAAFILVWLLYQAT